MKKILSILLTCCLLSTMSFSVAAETVPQTVILDNDNANNTSGTVIITGAEVADNVSSGIVADTEFGEFGSHYKVSRAMANTEISLSYEPELVAGQYSVYINRPRVAQKHAQMSVKVVDTQGTHEPEYSIISGEMDNDDEGYILIGTYDFSGVAGQDKVIVSKPAGNMGMMVYARWDSVKFVPCEENQPDVPTTPSEPNDPTPDTTLSPEIILDPTCAFAGMYNDSTEGRVVNSGASSFTVNEGTGYNGKTTAYRGYNGNPSSMKYYPKLAAKEYEVYMRVNVVSGSWGITNIKICNNNIPVYEVRHNWGAYNTANVVTDEDGNKWLPLGSFNFSGTGDADHVELWMGSGDTGYAYYNAIRFSPKQGMGVLSKKANGNDMGAEVSCYTDNFEIIFSNRIESITDSSATITDSTGKVISSKCSKNATKLKVELLESLKSGEEYTVTLSGITDCFGGGLGNTTFTFRANSSAVGSSTIDLSKPIVTNGKLIVSGKIYNSLGSGISGRVASVKLTNPSGTVIENELTIQSGVGGVYNLEYQMPANGDSGTYSVRASTAMCQAAAMDTVVYTNSFDETRILGELKGTTNWEVARNVITQNSSLFGLTTATFPDDEKLYDEFVGAEFTDLPDLVDAYDKAVAFEKMNQATDVADIKAVLETPADCSRLGIVPGSKTVLATKYDNFANSVMALERIESYTEFKNVVNDLFNSAMMLEYGISDEKLKEESISAGVGEGARFGLSFLTSKINVKSVEVELSSTDNIFSDFYVQNTGNATVTTTGNGTSRNVSIVFDTPVTAEKLADIMFTATSSMVGNRTVKATGTVTYQVENVPHNITADILESVYNITITASPPPAGGGGGGGGAANNNYPSNEKLPNGPVYSSTGEESKTPEKEEPDDNVTKPNTPASSFEDLDGAKWAEEAIIALYEKGIVSGVDEKNFEPNKTLTREQFVTMLVAAFAEETYDAEDVFGDSDSNAWYAKALTTAKLNGWISGYEDGRFGVGEPISREDMAVMVASIVFKGVITEKTDSYLDDGLISGYAQNSVYLMSEKGIMSGVGDNCFNPKGTATRAMAAKVIYELVKEGY